MCSIIPEMKVIISGKKVNFDFMLTLTITVPCDADVD